MSTHWGFACVSHDPPLVSEHWFNHGDGVLRDVYTRFHSDKGWPDDPRYPSIDVPSTVSGVLTDEPLHRVYATADPIYFLRQHPRCTVVLHNEYGDTLPLGGGS